MVVNGDVVAGALYDIRTVNGAQVLREVNMAALPPLAPPMVRPLPPAGADATQPRSDQDDGSVVDVLVLWTARAAKKAGGEAAIRSLIDLGVAGANDAYARSGVRFRLSLVGAEQTDFPDLDHGFELPFGLADDEAAAREEELEAQWEAVFAVRDRVGADVISIVMKMGFGGYANLMNELSPDFESLAHNFVHVDRVAYNTLAHELGHNMGLHHDRFVNPAGGIFPYSHGYVNQRAFDPGAARDTCWATIMAYLSQCRRGGHRLGMHIPYFSNPNLRYPAPHGDPLGIDESSTFTDARGPANAVVSLNKARHVVANFRPSLGDRGGATDHGDAPSEATAVLVRSSTRGLLVPQDVDYFRIDVPRTGMLRIETTGATDTYGELTNADSDGDFRGASDDNGGKDGNFLIEQQVKTGAYFVAVRGAAGAQGPYRLQVSVDWLRHDDHGDSAQQATLVAVPSSTDGVLGTDDVDYFRIDLAEAATLRVESSGNVDTYGTLAWPDGRAMLENDDGGGDQNFRIETALPAGTYVVAVRGFSARPSIWGHSHPATGFYTLNVWFGPDGQDDDHGDAWATATTVPENSATAGALETALDVDAFRIELPAPGKLRVRTTGDTDTRGRLFRESDGDYDELLANDDGGAGGNFLVEEVLASGTYLVEVRGFRGATTGGYTLDAAFAPGTDDHGDTEEEATAIALPSSGAGHAAHFHSHDLETGNPGKGLPAGVGAGDGDWRLLLGTALKVEPLAYVRTADGFLASMHDVVPATGLRHRVPVFNPAGNRQQASQLRLINANAEAAEVTISAVDDLGAAAPGGTVALTIPSGESRTVTARQLEAGGAALRGRLGGGVGKWRLTVAADRPVVVMSLQTRPDGGMTNVSSRPPARSPAATGHTLPLLLAGHRHPAQGFARVVNASGAAGEVAIHASSDAGRRFGPLALTLGARSAAHFNSADLEQGNAAKGLSGGTGSGEGDWRLEFSSELPIEVLGYARGPGGFLATMHDIAPSVGQTHRVPIFNPAGDSDQVSELRLANPGAQDADITIAATDDLGEPAPAGTVSLVLAARESRTVTARQLEDGAPNLAGRFGDGHGRWRLTVSASAPVDVMNLLRSADGRLVNLSTSPAPPLE